MAERVDWDKYEVALLIDACERVSNNNVSKTYIVKELSECLRNRARNKGLQIDEIFRNENGISMQMTKMDYLLTGGKKGLTGASKLFVEIAELRKHNSNMYNDILQKAKMQIETDGMKTANMLSQKDKFLIWLNKQPRIKFSAGVIISVIEDASKYAVEHKISKEQFWEISNSKDFDYKCRKLLGLHLFRVLHRKTALTLDKCYIYYKNFLVENEKKGGANALGLSGRNTRKDDIDIIVPKDVNTIKQKEPTQTVIEGDPVYVVTSSDEYLYNLFPELFPKVFLSLKHNKKQVYLTIEQLQKICNAPMEEIETILQSASWAEHFGGGYVIGKNNQHNLEFNLNLNIEDVYNSAYSDISDIEEILISDFKRGFRPNSIIDKGRFIETYEERFKNTISSDEILSYVKLHCFLFDGRYYLPKAIISYDIAKKLVERIQKYFEKSNVLFYDVIYNEFKEQFNSMIYNSEMLTEYLKFVIEGTTLYYKKKYFSYSDFAEPDIQSEVINYLIKEDKPCSYENIYAALAHINTDDVYHVLHNCNEIMGNRKTEYFHIKVAHIDDTDIKKLTNICEVLLQGCRYITCNEVIETLADSKSDIYDRLGYKFSTLGIRRIFSYYLKNYFDIQTGVITKKGESMSITDVFAYYARNHEFFTVSDIQELANYTGTVPYWGSISRNAIRINKNDFISDKLIEFNTDDVDEAIGLYCTDYIPLASIYDFNRFPVCDYPWNEYLLQSYVYRFSPKYKLEFLGFNKGSACGVIVDKQYDYPDFDSILLKELSKTQIKSTSEALQYLCDKGFIKDKRYKEVDMLLKKAIVIRNEI